MYINKKGTVVVWGRRRGMKTYLVKYWPKTGCKRTWGGLGGVEGKCIKNTLPDCIIENFNILLKFKVLYNNNWST